MLKNKVQIENSFKRNFDGFNFSNVENSSTIFIRIKMLSFFKNFNQIFNFLLSFKTYQLKIQSKFLHSNDFEFHHINSLHLIPFPISSIFPLLTI